MTEFSAGLGGTVVGRCGRDGWWRCACGEPFPTPLLLHGHRAGCRVVEVEVDDDDDDPVALSDGLDEFVEVLQARARAFASSRQRHRRAVLAGCCAASLVVGAAVGWLASGGGR